MVTMMSGPLFLAFFYYATMLWTPCNAYYYSTMEHRVQGKIHWMSRELMIDANMKVKSIQHYRDYYYKALQYQMGTLVYELRHFYKIMVEIYSGAEKNISYGYLNHTQNIKDMIRVHRISMEVESKVLMLTKWASKRESKKQHRERMEDPMRSGINQDYDELEDVPLWEALVRRRMAQKAAAVAGAPHPRALPAPAPDLGDTGKNQKWRHVHDDDFGRGFI